MVRRHAVLFLLIGLMYLLTLTDADFGRVADGQAMLDLAVNLQHFGDLKVGYRIHPDTGFTAEPGGGGRYGIGYPLIQQVPLVLVTPVEGIFGMGSSNILFPLTNLLLQGLTAVAISLVMVTMGRSFRSGALAAATFAFGTFAWPYNSYEFSEPVQALSVTAAFLFCVRAARRRAVARSDLILAGAALGLAVFSKVILLVLVPGFGLYLWLTAGGPAVARARRLAWFAGTLAVFGVILAATNLHRFGSILEFGYENEGAQFTTPLITGLYGLIMGPNKGLLFYAPVALLLPWGLWAGRRSCRPEVALLAGTVCLFLLTMAKWWGWEGGACWGPRLILPILPLVVVGAALVLDASRRALWPFAACLVAGIAVNLLGVLIHFMVWTVALTGDLIPLELEGRPEREYQLIDGRKHFPPWIAAGYVPSLSPIAGHAWLLGIRYLDTPLALRSAAGREAATSPIVPFGRAQVDFALVRKANLIDRLESAGLWLPRVMKGRSRGRTAAPVVGLSLERLGNVASSNGDAGRALRCYSRAFQLIPTRPALALKLAQTQARLGMQGEAIATLEWFLARTPGDAPARLELAVLHEEAGHHAAALAQYRAYLDLPSGGEEGRRRARERIQILEEGKTPSQPPGDGSSQR